MCAYSDLLLRLWVFFPYEAPERAEMQNVIKRRKIVSLHGLIHMSAPYADSTFIISALGTTPEPVFGG